MAAQRILVKAAGAPPSAALRFGAASAAVPFGVTPLFPSIGRATGRPRSLGVAGASRAGGAGGRATWYVLEAPPGLSEPNPWDLCHALMTEGFGLSGAPRPEFAEPDLQQQFIVGNARELGVALAATCDKADPQDPDFPLDKANPLWFRDQAHAQFDAALAKVGGPDVAAKVRIAHLDTGYDPQHKTLPKRLRRDLQHNFVDADRPNDASDTSSGLGNNLGHGTGTLSILAGAGVNNAAPVGAAPFAEVVPVRVANSVVLFYNSAIAQAFDYVHGLNAGGDAKKRIDIITMSMGGLASQAWADAVNALYEQGVFIVTAAGNNYGNLPTHNIVYPARFNRVVAACGVMQNHAPYADLDISKMAGNYGPASKMTTAMAACTPNVSWARFGCSEIVDHDGRGTSAATPQVAAAAALWLQQNRAKVDAYPQAWMRVEAIRKALFDSGPTGDVAHLGRGELRARGALEKAPAAASALKQQPADSASLSVLRVLTGLGLQAAPDPRQRMIELEALQLSQTKEIEELLPDPEAPPESITPEKRRLLAEALANQPGASQSLRAALGSPKRDRVPVIDFSKTITDAVQKLHINHATDPQPPKPTTRPLRVYAYDPSLGARLATLGINEGTLEVRWEDKLAPGPVGEYIEVIDVDPASSCCYAPVDLNHSHILTQRGLSPSESNPQFHQQMVYAVAMKTIDHFERALGRVALWAPRHDSSGKRPDEFVRRLRIYPHALRAQNAFYSPERKALLLGYFRASDTDSGDVLPGGVVFTAVSHDIVAHETTHALLDGLHRRFREATNPDILAFHEAFADIVALFQHFTVPEALRHQIAFTRGDLEQQSLLGGLALQFGQATGRYGALRSAIGQKKDPHAYQNAPEPHDRGAILVAAVFDAFLQLYKDRTTDLVRLATGGTGVLPNGAIPADLTDRLAQEASKVAGHVLNMCIRALDYCPPVDLTFGEYLRAVISADTDLVPDDKRGYRTAFIAAFRDRGIYPADVKHLSSGSLVWEPPPLPLKKVMNVLPRMKLDWDLRANREDAWEKSRENAEVMHAWLMNPDEVTDDEISALGLFRRGGPDHIGGIHGTLGRIEVHSVRPARRVGPDGQSLSDLVVEITQTFWPLPPDPARYRGGCTLLIDMQKGEVRYLVRKKVASPYRFAEQLKFTSDDSGGLRENYFGGRAQVDEPFAFLHRNA
jgi:hypothetical protein